MYKALEHTCYAFELFAIKSSPRLTGLPYLADRATRLGGSPHLQCKRDQDKVRIYMDRRVTPLKRVTSPTWVPHLHVNRPLACWACLG